MTEKELEDRLKRIEKMATMAFEEARSKGHFLILILLLILLARSC